MTKAEDQQVVLKDGDPKVAKRMCVCKCAGDFIPVADTTDVMACRSFDGSSCVNRKGDKRGQTEDCQIDLVYPGKPQPDDGEMVNPDLPASPPPAVPDAGAPTAPGQPGAVHG